MKNIIKLFGIIALAAVFGFSLVSCDDGGSSSESLGFTSWNRKYTGAEGRSADIRNHEEGLPGEIRYNSTEQEINDDMIAGKWYSFTINTGGEGKIMLGSEEIGRYAHITFVGEEGSGTKGILYYAVFQGKNYYHLGLGNKSPTEGVQETYDVIVGELGASFAPSFNPSALGIPTQYGWAGSYPK